MTTHGAYGEQLGRSYRLPNMPALMTQSIEKTPIAVTRCKFDKPNHGLTAPLPREDAFMVVLQLGNSCERDLWLEGKSVPTNPLAAGEVVFHDLRRSPAFNLRSPLDSLHFYLPRKTLDAVADDANSPRIEDLHFTPGIGVSDPILAGLGRLLLPGFDHPEQVSRLFVDHVTLAIGVHVAHTYGGMKKFAQVGRGGLAPWQEKRAKELLNANLDGDAARYQAVAVGCGFSDQAHFTRVYTRLSGISPGAWRRQFNDRTQQNDQQASAVRVIPRIRR
jgi:AraC family transcriptional regulator